MGHNKGERNGQWKGDKVGMIALHEWVRNRKPKPVLCERCQSAPPRDLANISGEYHRDINDFEWLCRLCHMDTDGRLANMHRVRQARREIGNMNIKQFASLGGKNRTANLNKKQRIESARKAALARWRKTI